MRFAVVAVLLFLSAVGLGYTSNQRSSAPTFMTAPVERGSIATLVKASGTVEAGVSVDVSSQLSGRIAEVFVNFNDIVRAGQPIAQIDPEIFSARVNEARAALNVGTANAHVQKAALERAKAAMLSAERELQRQQELARTGSGTGQALDQVRAQRAVAEAEQHMAEANLENAQAVVEQRQAALDQARLDLDRTVLRAPIDGIIIKRDVNPGQTVAVTFEAKTLFKIANDLREMEVHGKIDEADVGQLKVGQTTQFTVDAYPARTFRGQVLQIRKSPEVVQNVVTYTAIISAPNPDLLLLPGMTAQLRIVVSDTGTTLKIPNQALRFRPNSVKLAADRQNENQAASPEASATVWLVGEDGRPDAISVKLGVSDNNTTALLEGRLSEGQQLIVGVANSQKQSGHFGLRLGF